MNKPSQKTIEDLKEAVDEIAHVRVFADVPDFCKRSFDRIDARVRRALDQLTQDDELPCDWPGCRVRKPTRRALSAHYATAHGPRR